MGESPTRRAAPAGSNRSNCGGNEAEAFGVASHKLVADAKYRRPPRLPGAAVSRVSSDVRTTLDRKAATPVAIHPLVNRKLNVHY